MSTEEAIGTARIDVIVDTSQLDIAIDRAKNRTASMSTSAQQEYAKLDRAEKRRIDRLIDQANTLNLSKEQQLAYNAALKSSGTLLDDITRKIRENSQAQTQNGLSAKQTAAAMRGVPAQITDIFTSLQGGQKPLTVLLQQGGQLKDMFGGIGPAAKALGTQLLGLVNPYTIAAAAGIGLVAAWNEAADEASAFNRALIETGGYAGKTAAQMNSLAAELDGLAGVTTGSAAEAIAAVTATGRITGAEFDSVSRAVAVWSDATGESVDDVVKRFVKLADDPVKAILELNKSQHFLTEETLKQIESLEEQGRQAEAVTLAIQTYSDVLIQRAPQMKESLGNIEWAMNGLKNAARETADAIVGIFRASSNGSRIKELQSNIEAMQARIGNQHWWNGGGVYGGLTDDQLRAGIARQQAEIQRLSLFKDVTGSVGGVVDTNQHNADKKAQDEWDRLAVSNLSKQAKLEREIADIRKKGIAAGKSEADIEAQIANARARYKESLPKGSKGTKTDPTDSIIARLRQQIALNEEQAKSEDKLTTTERMMVQVRTELDKLGAKATPQARKLIENLLAQAKASGENAEAALAEAKAKEQLLRLNAQLAQVEQNQQRGIEVDLMGLGHGGDAADMLRRQLDIHRQYEDGLKSIRDRGVAENSEAWKQQEQALRESRDRMLDTERDYQKKRAEVMGDPTVGIRRATEDYIANAKDVAGQVEKIWGNALGGMEDLMVDFLVTGKADWKGFLTSLAADIARFMVQKAIVQFLEAFSNKGGGGASSSGGGGIWGEIAGAVIKAFSANAKGGVYTSPSLSAYSGQIVSQPTMFAFAKGAGLMGEAGPEAIMPLTRTAGGKLGVQAVGGGAGDVNVGITVNVESDGTSSGSVQGDDHAQAKQFGQLLTAKVKECIGSEMRPGGLLWKMQNG